ncbi:MAG TPA: hypothetical protein VNL39_14060 [Xanthobacteraceae bacterium]|nr:hypothetical protein [Xanthobacteraceae bacterium]
MKRMLLALALAVATLALATPEASAWFCRAESSWGSWGWGRSPSLRAARNRALWECARRTPRTRVCYIVYCRR